MYGSQSIVKLESSMKTEYASLKDRIFGWCVYITMRDYMDTTPMVKWCLDNSSSRVEIYGLYRDEWIRMTDQYKGKDCVSPVATRIWFKDEADAMAFKLRWS